MFLFGLINSDPEAIIYHPSAVTLSIKNRSKQ